MSIDNVELKVSVKMKQPSENQDGSASLWNESYLTLHPQRYPSIFQLGEHTNVNNISEKSHGPSFPFQIRQIGNFNISILSAGTNRYNFPWLIRNKVQTKSLGKSGHRILYSTLKEQTGDGVGHAMTVLNSELTTALNLGLTYSHRIGLYGSLTNFDPNAVEEIFGWGEREIPRAFLERKVCKISYVTHRNAVENDKKCPICTSILRNSKLRFDRIVEIPDYMSYGCITCQKTRQAADQFLSAHSENFTLFQMAPSHCDRSPKSPDFSLSQNFFYWKYWDKHGAYSNSFANDVNDTFAHLKTRPTGKTRVDVALNQEELTVAIHARRGDFFNEKQRKMVSSDVFAGLVRKVVRIVKSNGGRFADMPVVVFVYSEGRLHNLGDGYIHDVSHMDREYLDTDGKIRDARWFHRLIDHGNTMIAGNKSHTLSEKSSVFPTGLRVEFRISTPLSESLHEMVSADVFIGSPSDLSEYVVRILSRSGLTFLPTYMGALRGCCTVTFDINTGEIRDAQTAKDYWSLYSFAMDASLPSNQTKKNT